MMHACAVEQDASEYIDSRVCVTVVDATGTPVGRCQDTPFSASTRDQYLMFGHTVHIQQPLEEFKAGKCRALIV